MSNHDDQLKGSEARLWRLIAERAKPSANTHEIDARIWDLFGDDWAIMFTDLSGFSRQVAKFGIIHPAFPFVPPCLCVSLSSCELCSGPRLRPSDRTQCLLRPST